MIGYMRILFSILIFFSCFARSEDLDLGTKLLCSKQLNCVKCCMTLAKAAPKKQRQTISDACSGKVTNAQALTELDWDAEQMPGIIIGLSSSSNMKELTLKFICYNKITVSECIKTCPR